MRLALLALLIAAPLTAQDPDSVVTETRTAVPIPAPIVVNDPATDSTLQLLREHMADAALKPDATPAEIALAYAILDADPACPCDSGAPWWVDRVLILGLGIGTLWVLKNMERSVTTTTINNEQSQEQGQETTVTTTVKHRWDRRRKHGRDD